MASPEVLELSSLESEKKYPVTILDKWQFGGRKDDKTGRETRWNLIWIKGKKHPSKFVPGGFLIDPGLSGGPEIETIMVEQWSNGILISIFIEDPRPSFNRFRRFEKKY